MADPWKRREVIGDATLYLGDCLEILPTLPKANAVVTSPPYLFQRDYGSKIEDWDGLMCGCFGGIQHEDGCQILVNLGQIHIDGEVRPYWEAWREYMRGIGWRFFGWYVWDQGAGLPGDWNGRLAPSHEYIFHFNKLPYRPNKIEICKYAGTKNHGTGNRRADGSLSKYSHIDSQVQQTKIPDSVIRLSRFKPGTGGEYLDHPAVFPVSLPQKLVAAYTSNPALVLDPFMGSGTTGVACMNLGRKFFGIEIEERYFNIAVERITNAQRQQRMFA